ncbi:hypothetical protein K1T71_007889 [Dendrolimus kikuchii]|uniref:Uncharacterized protein n=1 Tax=Dendrolimus kikuchii TaxID=765133 RepID=A0ACC1CYR5_9NEOP|nr:hypothetical protein K1T71_007889 [Dendrolimus kikuchii]
MPSCIIKMCRNYFKRGKDKDNISFHRLPADPIVADYWIKVIRESQDDHHWNPNKRSLVRSNHFEEKEIYISKKGYRKIKKGAVPNNVPFSRRLELHLRMMYWHYSSVAYFF